MRSRSVVPALILTAVAATVAVRRLGARTRRAVQVSVPARPAPARVAPVVPAPAPVVREAVVLPFTRPAGVQPAPAPAPAAPARCGDSGGRTKAGAPCGARATSSGRCHHHRVAA